jgi:hypothetical protein
MKNAATLLSYVISTLQLSSLCHQVKILEVNTFTDQQFAFKVRAELHDGRILQVRLYFNYEHIDYAYQLIQNDKPAQRWDNKEHFPQLSSYPHHYHTVDGQVVESPLNGQPEHDLPLVLDFLSAK